MKEILEKIQNEISFIKEQQNELEELTENSENLRKEYEQLKVEKNLVTDKESGFYKDLSEKISITNDKFIEANNKRMNKNDEINKVIFEKKQEIKKELADKKQYIDENRNVNLEGIDLAELKAEKEKLEKEIELNNTTKEEFNQMSDSEKYAVKKAKENYLNNKHRLDEINPTIELMDMLDGKNPKDRYIEIENLEKVVDENFNRDNLNKVTENIDNIKSEKEAKLKEEQEAKEKAEEEARLKEEQEAREKAEEEARLKAEQEEKERIDEKVRLKTEIEQRRKIEATRKRAEQEKTKIVLEVSENRIKIDKLDYEMFYKEEANNKKELAKEYAVNTIFYNDKKTKRNIDWALVSALKNIDDNKNTLVMDYFSLIKGSPLNNKDLETSLNELNKKVNIEYRFNEEHGFLLNLREKRLARNANLLGIGSLSGISEKSLWDKIKDRFENIKLLTGKEKTKELDSGEMTMAEQQKRKVVNQIYNDMKSETNTRKRDLGDLKEYVLKNNSNGEIEKNAQMQMNKQEEKKNETPEIAEEQETK